LAPNASLDEPMRLQNEFSGREHEARDAATRLTDRQLLGNALETLVKIVVERHALEDANIVRELVKSRQKVVDARDALSAAEDEDARRYQAALTAGWTVDELRSAGLGEPEKKLRFRKRAARRNTPTSEASAQREEASHHG
jgi:hypothetical protein